MKKKIFAVFFALLVLCTAVVPVFADEADDWDFSEEYPTAEPTGVTINVYNWGEYISNGTEGSLDVNAEFTRRTGIEVNYTTFDSNESLYSKLAGGGASYDVIVPSDYMISKLMNENMLAELDFSNIPNFEYIDEQFRNPDYDPEIAGANMDFVGYATPETAAKDYLDPDAVANPIYYPDQDVLDRTEVFVNLPSETSNLLDTLWAEVKMGGPGQSAVLIAIILVFLAVYIAIIIWKKQKRKRETGG